MATADEARRLRIEKGAVNHTTYRGIFDKIVARIELRAKRGETRIEYRVPAFVPGRPMYDISHAVRYCRDKLTHRGFTVNLIPPDILVIDWRPVAARPSPAPVVATTTKPSPPPRPRASKPTVVTNGPKNKVDIKQRLEVLARRLNWN